MVRRLLSFLLLSFLATSLAHASVGADEMLKRASDDLFTVFKTQRQQVKESPERIYALVNDTLGPHVDFPLVSQLVLGKHWRTASPEQRERFVTEFRKLLIRFYVGAFVDDPRKLDDLLNRKETVIEFQAAELNPDGVRATVRAGVHLPSGQVVPVAFAVHHKSEDWKVYDVVVDGISLITNYRTSFSNEIQQTGLDKFLDHLAERNRELAVIKTSR
jgi:phospholipid transport system substrate-binding protein